MSAAAVLHISALHSNITTLLVLKMLSLDLKLYFVDFHRGYSVAKALLAKASLGLMFASVLPCLFNTALR